MKIARIWSDKLGDTYGIISEDGSLVVSKSDFQEQTGFVPVPEPGGWRFSLLIGLLAVGLIGNHQHRHAAGKARRFTPLESQ